MADSDQIIKLQSQIREIEARIKQLEQANGGNFIRIANRQQGGGGIRWTEYTGP